MGSPSRRRGPTWTRSSASGACTRRRIPTSSGADSVVQQREHELRARELVVAGTLQSEAVEHEIHERAQVFRGNVVAELAVPLGLLDAGTVRRSELLLPFLDAPTEGRVDLAGITWRYDDGEPTGELAVT